MRPAKGDAAESGSMQARCEEPSDAAIGACRPAADDLCIPVKWNIGAGCGSVPNPSMPTRCRYGLPGLTPRVWIGGRFAALGAAFGLQLRPLKPAGKWVGRELEMEHATVQGVR